MRNQVQAASKAGIIADRIDSSNTKKWDEIEKKIKNDLVDFKTRDIINTETKDIRNILVAKAFYPYEEGLSKPPGDISDPVGFDIDD